MKRDSGFASLVMLPIEFHPAAVQEAEEAKVWYSKIDPALAESFCEEFETTVERIADSPKEMALSSSLHPRLTDKSLPIPGGVSGDRELRAGDCNSTRASKAGPLGRSN